MTALYVALAGALGTLSRYGLGLLLARVPLRFPLPTFAVNVLGAFAIGAAVEYLAGREGVSDGARVAVTVGFLGGFTTYSAFALETVTLLERRHVGAACAYVGLTLLVAGLACALGIGLVRRLP